MKTNTTYKIDELLTSISFGEGSSFKEQLLNDESFRILSGIYGKYPQGRSAIEQGLQWLFQDFDKQYYETALSTLKIGGLPLDVQYNEAVTIN